MRPIRLLRVRFFGRWGPDLLNEVRGNVSFDKGEIRKSFPQAGLKHTQALKRPVWKINCGRLRHDPKLLRTYVRTLWGFKLTFALFPNCA